MKEELVKNKNNLAGQSILEVIIALGLFVFILSSAVYLVFNSQFSILSQKKQKQAVFLAKNNLELARNTAENDFSSLVSFSKTEGEFLKELIVEDVDNDTKKVISRVSYQDRGIKRKVELVSYLTNWRNISLEDSAGLGGASGGGGSSLSGDWSKPFTLSTFDLGPGNEGRDVLVKFSTVFLAAKAADEKKPDFYIVDVSDPSKPSLKAKLNTGEGLNSLALSPNYAFLAHDNSWNQLQIVDIQDETKPFLVAEKSLFHNEEEALAIFSKRNYVYIGSEKSLGKEFQIFDVSDPLKPTFLNAVEIGADVNDIFVLNNRAYLATSDPNREIIIYDVSDPKNVSLLAEFNYLENEDGLSVFPYDNNFLFAGIDDKLVIIDISDLSNISVVGEYNAGDDINDLYAREYLAFLATASPNKEFQVINIEDFSNPYLYSSYNFPQVATGIDYRDNIIYISVRSNDALRIITSQ